MRHKVAGYKLGRTSGARVALRRNLMQQLFTHERIRTTKAKAAAIRGEAEQIITIARNSANAAPSARRSPRAGVWSPNWVTTRSSNACLMRSRLVLPIATADTPACMKLARGWAIPPRWSSSN